MGALYELTRDEVTSKIQEEVNAGNKIIITGLDGSGKTTELKKHIGSLKYIKTDASTSDWYFNTTNMDQTETIREFLDEYNLFDRHPIIDYAVYHYASLIESKDGTKDDLIKFLNEHISTDTKFSIFVYFDDQFVNKTKQNPWIAILRPFIKDLYREACYWFNMYTASRVFMIK